MKQRLPLAMVSPGEVATVVDIRAGHGLTRRLADMGLVPGTAVKVINSQISGPIIIEVRGSKLILGHGMTQKITVEI